MYFGKRLLSLILFAVMLIAAAGCSNAKDKAPQTTSGETVSTAGDVTDETEAVTDTETATQPTEPDPVLDCEWVIEPGIFRGDIQPVPNYSPWHVNLGLAMLDGKHLIDFNGNIKYTAPDEGDEQSTGMYFCGVCCIILPVEPETYEAVGHVGHGGYRAPNYIYDPETGFICYPDYGGYAEVNENIPYSIVAEGIRRPATSEDNVGNDYAYDLTGRYGIVVNSELVVPFEYDGAAKYDNFGIAKLKKDGKWALFNTEGKMILGNDYLSFSNTTDGCIALNRDGKWGYVDTEGNTVIDYIFEEALPPYCGKAWVKTDAGWGVVKVTEPAILTEEEAKLVIYESLENPNLISADITPNGKKYYECVGYGFDVKASYTTGYEHSRYYFVNYDGTMLTPQYSKQE